MVRKLPKAATATSGAVAPEDISRPKEAESKEGKKQKSRVANSAAGSSESGAVVEASTKVASGEVASGEVHVSAVEANTKVKPSDEVKPSEEAEVKPSEEAEVKPEEEKPGEEVIVGHEQTDIVALGKRADQLQRAEEEAQLPCFSRCCLLPEETTCLIIFQRVFQGVFQLWGISLW